MPDTTFIQQSTEIESGTIGTTSTGSSLEGSIQIDSNDADPANPDLSGSTEIDTDWQVSVEEGGAEYTMESEVPDTGGDIEKSGEDGGTIYHKEEATPDTGTEIKVETSEPTSGTNAERDGGNLDFVAVPETDTTLVYQISEQRDGSGTEIHGATAIEAKADDLDYVMIGEAGSTTTLRDADSTLARGDELVFVPTAETDTTLVYEVSLERDVSREEIVVTSDIDANADETVQRESDISLSGSDDSRLAFAGDEFIFG